MNKERIFASILLLSMVVFILAGCAPTPATTSAPAATSAPVATSAPAATKPPAVTLPPQVTIAIGADPADLSPFVGMSMGRIAVLKNVYEYLLETDTMGGTAVPMIAKSVEKAGDKTTKVTIFDNVKDSAGNKITAADVAWSYNQGITAGKMRPLGDIVSVKATGDYTVEFVFKVDFGPGGLDKILTECPIISQKAYEASPDKFASKPVTTSSYVLTSYVPGSTLTFEARADYWQTDAKARTLFSKANVQKIVYQVITEPAQNAIALETGKADISASVTGDDVARFKSKPEFTVFNFLDNLTQVLEFNGTEGNPFAKKELRQAVAYAIDTKAMCQAVAPGACAPAHTIGNANFGGYQAKWDTEPYYEFDLAKAQQLFTASGFKPGELTVKLLGQNDAKTGLMAQIIQAALAQLKINVTISLVETAVYNQISLDPKAYDLLLNASAGGDFIFNPWQLIYDQNRNKGTTFNFFKDDKLQSLLMAASSSVEGFTPANLDAVHQYQKDVLYAYGLLSYQNIVVSTKGVNKIVRDTRGQIVPGACEFAADFKKR